MNWFIGAGLLLIGLGLTILLVLYVQLRYVTLLTIRMPVMQWMKLHEIVALGVPKWNAKIGLLTLIRLGVAEVRLLEQIEQDLIDEAMEQGHPEGEDIEIYAEFSYNEMDWYEYRLRFRPRRRIKVKREAPTLGELVPA